MYPPCLVVERCSFRCQRVLSINHPLIVRCTYIVFIVLFKQTSSGNFWVSKWVDYTDKYGLGYQLCDNSIGVLFNDNTRVILLNNQK